MQLALPSAGNCGSTAVQQRGTETDGTKTVNCCSKCFEWYRLGPSEGAAGWEQQAGAAAGAMMRCQF
jgi:hypothetical protein